MVNNFDDFCARLRRDGFSLAGGDDKGIYSIIPFTWQQPAPDGCALAWHTGEPDTDPWEFRMRVMEETRDIAYAKLFFNTGGYITKDWYPYFIACRRTFEADEAYSAGKMSHPAYTVYKMLEQNGAMPMHILKREAAQKGLSGAEAEKGALQLQMSMYATICGRKQKTDSYGFAYGWNSTVLQLTDDFWAERGGLKKVDAADAYDKICNQIILLNPNAKQACIKRFILGK